MAMFHSPGPCHGLPTLVGKEKHDFRSVHFCNPAWPFGIRPKGTGKDECSPGAGAYSIDPKMQRTGRGYSPQYSIASRRPDPAQAFKPPGPGAYCPEKCGHIASRIPPSFTFGKRHKLRSMDQTPGKKSAPSAIIRSRNAQGRFDEDLGKTPGPASYDTIDTDLFKNRIPAYSMGHKFGLPGDGTVKPGPSTYNPYYRDGMDGTPHYSLYSRREGCRPFNVPGPGTYRPENCGEAVFNKDPLYSFGYRTKLRSVDNVPAPNRYTLPPMLCTTIQSQKPQAPCYTMRKKPTVGGFDQDMAKAPGPGTYSVIEPVIYKDRAPLWSCALRFKDPGDRCPKPGPGAHRPENVVINKHEYPSFSFGIHHSAYLHPLIVDAPTE
nr:hypothetical protein BaRGS_021464 [Batillaria attramentaria]